MQVIEVGWGEIAQTTTSAAGNFSFVLNPVGISPHDLRLRVLARNFAIEVEEPSLFEVDYRLEQVFTDVADG